MELLAEVSPEPILEISEPKDLATPRNWNLWSQWRKRLIYVFSRVQKYSAYAFLGFFGLHSATVMIMPGLKAPMDMCQEAFEAARLVYMIQPLEYVFSGAMVAHVASGMAVRMLRVSTNRNKQINNNHLVSTESDTDESGLGGITSLIGLGTRRSIVSQTLGLTPLSFSGYILAPLILYHRFKFKLAPIAVDEDRAAVSLQYVGVVLRESMVKYGNAINKALLVGLVMAASYHFVSGMLRFSRKNSKKDKKRGYGIISVLVVLALVSVRRLERFNFDNGYLHKTFVKYVEYTRL